MENTPEEIELIKKSALFFVGLDKLVRGIKLYEGQGSLVEQLLKTCGTGVRNRRKIAERTRSARSPRHGQGVRGQSMVKM